MEIQKASNSQSSLEKEEWNQTILQSYSHKDSMVLAQRQKNRSMEQNEIPEINPCTLDTLSLTKEARIYNGERQSL